MGRRRIVVSLLAAALGLFAGPSAQATSCSGGSLRVVLSPSAPLPPDPTNVDTQLSYVVRPGQRLTVQALNLGPCVGRAEEAAGCGAEPPPDPDPLPAAIVDVSLFLEQGSRRWHLGVADAPAPQYVISYPVTVPRTLRPGSAALRLRGATYGEVHVRLRVSP